MAAQQRLCYIRSGLPLTVDEKYILEYIPGTKPERYIGADETATIKQLLITTLDQFETDYNNQVFSNSTYDAFVNRYGVELNAIDDVIDYLPYHEGPAWWMHHSIKKTGRKEMIGWKQGSELNCLLLV